ncbi:hypothetical protein ACIPL1_26165 [Pseudomonas sp. NPDC090202]|uniref:hypothetical protein n=1 Tax=unclassified Pseudomonas TaxID=196821 RepID=UPI003806C486
MSKSYAFINDTMINYSTLRDNVVTDDRTRAKFDQLNAHIFNQVVMPGQLVLVSDHPSPLYTPEETELMSLARDVYLSMIGNGYTSGKLMTQNYDLLQSIMSYGSIGIGSSTAAWSKHLKELESTLKEIETLLKSWRSKAIGNDQFFAQRQLLFGRLDKQLQGVGHFASGLKRQGKIKKMLGISSKSYLHTGEIAGYAKTVKKISKTASVLGKGTYVGIALDVGVGALEIQEACSIGREEQCAKAKYVNSVKTGIGITGSAAGAVIGEAVFLGLCIGLSVPSGGAAALVCSIVGGAAGAYTGGIYGSEFGELTGLKIYESQLP